MNKILLLMILSYAAQIAYLQFNQQVTFSTKGLSESMLQSAQSTVRDKLLSIHYSILSDRSIDERKKFMVLGMFYDLYGYHELSTVAYKTAIFLDPSNWEPLYQCGRVAVKLGQYDEGLKLYEQALNCQLSLGQQSRVYYNLGMLYLRMGMAKNAESSFKQAIEKEDNPFAQYELIKLKLNNDKTEPLNEKLYGLLTRFPMSSELYNLCLRANESGKSHIKVEMNETRESILHQEFEFDADYEKRKMFRVNVSELIESERQESMKLNEFRKILQDEVAVKQGESIYKSKGCAVCHGQDANGISGPNLTDDYWINGSSPSVIYTIIKDGRRDMPRHAHLLTSEEIWSVVGYVYQINLKSAKYKNGISNGRAAEGSHFSLNDFISDKGWNVP